MSLADVDPALGQNGHVRAARLLSDGRVRLVFIEDTLLSLIDLSPDGQPKLVAPAIRLPFAATSLDPAANVLIQADGSVYVLTAGSDQTQLVRITSAGGRDTTFKAPPAGNALAMADIAVQPNGAVVIAYRTRDLDSRVIRYLPSGAIDLSFGVKGVVQIKDLVYGIEMGSDGKLYVVGAGVGKALDTTSAFVRITRLLAE